MGSKIVNVEAKCVHCRNSLMDETIVLHDKPSIRVMIETKEGKGEMYLCSIYGCYDHKTDVPIAEDEEVRFFCAECEADLNTHNQCNICGASMVSFTMKWGGGVNICSRNGCDNHSLEFHNVADALRSFHHNFGIDL